MATWDDVTALAMAMPEATEEPIRDQRAWRVRKKLFVWERPLRAKEIEQLGAAAPVGEIVAVRVPDEEAKLAMIESEPRIYFTTPHFDGYPSVLALLERIPRADLEEAIVESWLTRAPKRLAQTYLDQRGA